MSDYLNKFKRLSKDLKAKEKKSVALREQSAEVRKVMEEKKNKELPTLLRDIILGEELLKQYKWEAMWEGFSRHASCDGDPLPVTLGVEVDQCKHKDPIGRFLEETPSTYGDNNMVVDLEDGVSLRVRPFGHSARMAYVIVFHDIDMGNFLPWFKLNVSQATCLANAQTVADFVNKHELTVKPPRYFKQTLQEHEAALESGKKIASLIGLVGFKKKPKAKEGKK